MIVEFKLHNGKVPYFIDKYLSYKVKGLNSEKENDRYIGTVKSNSSEYIPDTLVELTKEQATELIKTAKIAKIDKTDKKEKSIELTDKEKITLLEEKITTGGNYGKA